jgi:hypothetical protein
MVSAISYATQTQGVAQSTGASTPKPTQSKPQSATTKDTVQLSSVAQAMLAAVQEATETPVQTAQEATGGDLQAQRLLAKEAPVKSGGK